MSETPPPIPPSEPSPEDIKKAPEPISQATEADQQRVLGRPTFLRDFPKFFGAPHSDPNFQLLPTERLNKILVNATPEVVAEIQEDMKTLEKEVMNSFFRHRDSEAKRHQNRYRKYQISYIILAFFATFVGGLQALATDGDASVLVTLAFIETVIALSATFIAALSGFEPPLQEWIENRRIAEFLRQEYFRYLLRIDPYDQFADKAQLKIYLAQRAAEINQGRNPDVKADKGAQGASSNG